MNKFAAIILLAFVAVASAEQLELGDLETDSELSLNPSESEETAGLEGPFVIFNDFCLQTRDYVVGDYKKTTNGLASTIFSVFFSSATKLGMEAVTVQKDAAEKLGEQIRNPESPIADYDHENEVETIIAEGQQNIQEHSSQPRSLFQGIVSTLAATKNVITNNVLGQLNQWRSQLGVAAVAGVLKEVCGKIDAYDREIQSRFDTYVAEMKGTMQGVKLEQVNCLTGRRIIRLDGICKTVMAIQSPLIKAVAYKPIGVAQ